MRLFTKIFFCFMLVFGAAFQASGYLLISHSFENDAAQEKRYALEQFRYCKYMVQSSVYRQPELLEDREEVGRMARSLPVNAAFYGPEREELYCGLDTTPGEAVFEEAAPGEVSYQFAKEREKESILMCGRITQGQEYFYLITETDISAMLADQRETVGYFKRLYLAVTGVGFLFILLLAGFLTGPINRVSAAARRMAQGSYKERIRTAGKDEIGQLAENFNRMAQTVEEKMEEMSTMVRQKEDFVANFAHEMKTPLTSVIGYADMLCGRELPARQVREAAEYIVREGMRLEALAFKLMDLSALSRQDFRLEWLEVPEIFDHMAKGMEPVCRDEGIRFHMEAQGGMVWAEFDLLVTLLVNLLDNAAKADSTEIRLEGKREGERYRITVRDNGKGIAPGEIGRVTEAFYMGDKSRSRKRHGSGLGLSLAERIAEIHGSRLVITSDGRSGTDVSIWLGLGGEGEMRDEA